ncbi:MULTISPECIES: phage minor capsid protein [Bacillus]|uniref:phage minor capsid protein n=1 Tax=Bacillus TaxID=1386 RepID=UPI0002F776C0|nr:MULTISPECIES: phage minor capsid protein [Bacillus]
MTQPPTPNYDYDVAQLVKLYEKAIDKIMRELERVDLDNFTRANQLATLKSIAEILEGLDSTASVWASECIEKAVKDGIISTIISLGVVKTVAEAEDIFKFNRINKEFVKAAVADTQADLLAVTQNVDKKVRATVRKVSAEVLRSNLTQGINGTQTLKRDITAELRKQLGDSLNSAIIDAAGRRWRPSKYVEVLVRTKMMEAHRESTINEGVSRGALYGVVSKHGAKDACGKWEGKVLKLTPDAPGDYTYVGDIPRNELWHPCCKHQLTAVRKPERYV